jgi:hypothetical protein
MVSSRMLSHTMATNVDTEVAVGIPKLAFTTNRCGACIMLSFPTFIIIY